MLANYNFYYIFIYCIAFLSCNFTMGSNSIPGSATVVMGTQWGDEGKGKFIDFLAKEFDLICRCQGGSNAGHTVLANDKVFNFHLIPSGILHPNVTCIIGNGVVLNLPEFFQEINTISLQQALSIQNRIFISDRCHLVFDIHQYIDGSQEVMKGQESLGTTRKGIGPCYASKIERTGIRLGDLVYDFENFTKKFHTLIQTYQKSYPTMPCNVEEQIAKYRFLSEQIKPYVTDTITLLNTSLMQGKRILIEGANAALLDIDFGTYPYVTSSNCTVGGVCTGLGIPAQHIGEVYGVAKAYCTRVGNGPFPTELHGDIGKYLQGKGQEFGVTTGRKRRCGWFDATLIRYTNLINKYDALIITKLDILDELQEIKIGINYLSQGKIQENFPITMAQFRDIEVEYITLPGWQTNTKNITCFTDLPIEAQDYLKAIEYYTNIPIRWIGTGQDRSSIITRNREI